MNYEMKSSENNQYVSGRSKTKMIIGDIFQSLKISLIIYAIVIVGAFIIATIYTISNNYQYKSDFIWGYGIQFLSFSYIWAFQILRYSMLIGMIVSCVGLFLTAVGFAKPIVMRPLDSEKQWRIYYEKINIILAIGSICFFTLIYSLSLDVILVNLLNM